MATKPTPPRTGIQMFQRQQALHSQLQAARTLAEYNKIIETARAEKITLDAKLVSQTQNTLQKTDMAAKSKAYEDQQAKLAADKAAADARARADAVARASAANAAAVAKTQAAADAKAKADAAQAAAEKVNADRLAAQVAADAKRDADRAAEAAKVEAERRTRLAAETPEQRSARENKERILADPKALAAKRTELEGSIQRATSQDQIATALVEAKDFNLAINQGIIDRGTAFVQNATALQKAKALQEKTTAFQNEVVQATTQAQLDDVLSRARAENITVNPGFVNQAQTAVKQKEAQAVAAATAAKTADFERQIQVATTPDQIQSIVTQAKTQGITPNEGVVAKAQTAIKSQQAQVDFAKTLGTPAGFNQTTGPNGQSYVSRAADPVTGDKGGWFMVAGGGLQAVGADGRATGPVIPNDQFNQQQQQATSNYNAYATQQKKAADATRLAEQVKTFEENLPEPGSAKFKYFQANRDIRTGPDGRDYEIVAGTHGTNEPSRWVVSTSNNPRYTNPNQEYVSLNNPGQTITKDAITQVYKQNDVLRNQEYQEKMARIIAEQRAKENFNPIGDLLADFDKLVNKTVGWKTIATIAGSIIGGPLGATFANAAAGAIAGESIQDIAKGAALTFAMAYGTQALTKALQEGVAQGLTNGTLDASDDVFQFADDVNSFNTTAQAIDDVYQISDLPQSVIDMAMATDDPIAALNAAQGFGNVDPAYLQQIGATDDLIAVAEAHNTVNQFTGGGGGFVGSEYSYIPDEFYGPPTEFAGPVTPVEQFTPPAEFAVEPVAPGAPVAGTPGTEGFTQAELNAATYDPTAPLPPGTQYASTGPTGVVTVETGAVAPETVFGVGDAPPPGYLGNISELTPTDLANLTPTEVASLTTEQLVALTPAQISAIPGAVSGAIAPEVLAAVGIPLVVGGAIAAGGGGGGAAATTTAPTTPFLGLPGPEIAPPVPVTPEPVINIPNAPAVPEVTPSPEGDIIDGVQTPANPTQPVPAPQPSPPVPDLPIPPVIVPPGVVAPPGPVAPPVTTPPVITPPGSVTPTTPGAPSGTGTTPGPTTPGTGGPPGGSSQYMGPDTGLVTEPPIQPVQTPGTPGQSPMTDYSTPYEGPYSDQSVLERYLEGKLSFDNITGLIAAGLVLPSVLGLLAGAPQPTMRRPNYGPIPPINFGTAGNLVMPGVNPGFIINPAQQPFYQTTDPVQAKYAYTQRPLVTRPEDVLSTYQDRQYAPATPFGLQQGQQQYDLSQVLQQINQQPLDPRFVGYSQYPTAGYRPPIFNPAQAVGQAQYIPTGTSSVMGPIAPG